MRRRLRKKLRRGEFTQLGFTVKYRPKQGLATAASEALLDRFICQAIEASDLHCGGGGGPEAWEFFVCANGRRSATDADRQGVQDWLKSQADVTDVFVAPLQDAWHDEDDFPHGAHVA